MTLQLISPRVVREILAQHGLAPNKRLGQNFLIDGNILEKILAAAEPRTRDIILEIGPGLGVLTAPLAQKAGQVVAVEVDKGLIPVLEENLAHYSNIKIVQGDILKIPLAELIDASDRPVKVVANLPYYITSPIIMTLLTGPLLLERLVVMVQQEVARRMVAIPHTKDYGILSAAVQYYTNPEITAVVPGTVFYPSPAVDSAIVTLKVLDQPPVEVGDEDLFFRIVRGAFGHRRKTILNSLHGEFHTEYTREEMAQFLRAAAIKENCRGETLGLEEFARLSRNITDSKCNI